MWAADTWRLVAFKSPCSTIGFLSSTTQLACCVLVVNRLSVCMCVWRDEGGIDHHHCIVMTGRLTGNSLEGDTLVLLVRVHTKRVAIQQSHLEAETASV